MDELFHPTLYNGCNYLSMLGLKLIHVSKSGPSSQLDGLWKYSWENTNRKQVGRYQSIWISRVCNPYTETNIMFPFMNFPLSIHALSGISEGPTSNQCHVTAIESIGRRNLNLDPEVFCGKVCSKIDSYLNKHEIWPKCAILSRWWLHTKLKRIPKGVFEALSSSWIFRVSDFWG